MKLRLFCAHGARSVNLKLADTGVHGLRRRRVPEEMRQVTHAQLIAWRKELERRSLAKSSIRRKLAAVASLFDHLCEVNAVTHNPVRGVKRPKADTNEGKTPALGDGQARALLEAPPADTLKRVLATAARKPPLRS